MTLYNSTSLILMSSLAANELPAPATVANRTHILVNNGPLDCTWTATGGGTPFTVAGVFAATLNVPNGETRTLQAVAGQWVVAPVPATGPPPHRVMAATAVTSATGDATFTFVPPFAVAPVVASSLQTTNANMMDVRVTALSASGCTVNARQSSGLSVLGLTVLGLPVPLVGATVHVVATEAGQGV